MPLALVAVYSVFFKQSITGTVVLGAFLLEIMARMILSGRFRHAIEYINNKNAHTKWAPFSCVVTGSVKLVHGPLAS